MTNTKRPNDEVSHDGSSWDFAHKLPSDFGSQIHVHSTGSELYRDDELMMWWIGDDLYFTPGYSGMAFVWINTVTDMLGMGSVLRYAIGSDVTSEYTYNGRPIGQDEVIKLEIPT